MKNKSDKKRVDGLDEINKKLAALTAQNLEIRSLVWQLVGITNHISARCIKLLEREIRNQEDKEVARGIESANRSCSCCSGPTYPYAGSGPGGD